MKKYLLVCGLAALIVAVDQITKWYVRSTISLYESIVVIQSLVDITHVKNTGGAFGLFHGAQTSLRMPFFLAVSVVAVTALLYFVRRVADDQRLLLCALGGILGGALGNFIDRMTAGEVTDFLYVHWHEYAWPAFNVADSCISVGMIVLLVHSFLVPDEDDVAHSSGRA